MSYSPELNAAKREYLTAYRAAGAARRRTITNAKQVRKRTIAASRRVPKWWKHLFLVENSQSIADEDYRKAIEEAREEHFQALYKASEAFAVTCRRLGHKRIAQPVALVEQVREEKEMRGLEGV